MSGMAVLAPTGEPHVLFGFTSRHRFIGRFNLTTDQLDVVVTLGTDDCPGRFWDLEEFLSFPLKFPELKYAQLHDAYQPAKGG